MKQDRRSQTDTLIAPVLRIILKRFGGIESIDLDGLPSALADQIIENDFKKRCSAQIFSKNSSPDFDEVCQLSGAGQTIFTRFSEEIDNEYAVTVNDFQDSFITLANVILGGNGPLRSSCQPPPLTGRRCVSLPGPEGLPPGGQWRCPWLAKVSDIRLRDGPWHAGDRHNQPQGCVEIVDFDVNPARPFKPKRRL